MTLAQSQVITESPIKNHRLTWDDVKEIRKLHDPPLMYTCKRLAVIFGVSESAIKHSLPTASRHRQCPATVRHHYSVAAVRRAKLRQLPGKVGPSLWSHLAVIALKRQIPYRGFSHIEIVSGIKGAGEPLSDAERDIIDEICGRYGMPYEDVPSVSRLVHKSGQHPKFIHPRRRDREK